MPQKKKTQKRSDITVGEFEKLVFNKFNLTKKQKEFLKIAFDENTKIVFLSGPSGCSKTFLAVYAALQLYNMSEDYKDILYVRTTAESAERSLGFLPGIAIEKFEPFLIPLEEKLHELLKDKNQINYLFENQIIEPLPVNFIRGASWKNKIVHFEEAQNATFKELTTVITRIGQNCKIFICGDPMQSDINGKSGFADMLSLFEGYDSEKQGIHVFKFFEEDIMRSEILKFIVKKIENRPKNK